MIVTAAAKNGSATLTHTLTNQSDSPVKQRAPGPHPLLGGTAASGEFRDAAIPRPGTGPGTGHQQNPGDGRDRTDDPLLAKQVLSH